MMPLMEAHLTNNQLIHVDIIDTTNPKQKKFSNSILGKSNT